MVLTSYFLLHQNITTYDIIREFKSNINTAPNKRNVNRGKTQYQLGQSASLIAGGVQSV
jgi:hypothetical protein